MFMNCHYLNAVAMSTCLGITTANTTTTTKNSLNCHTATYELNMFINLLLAINFGFQYFAGYGRTAGAEGPRIQNR